MIISVCGQLNKRLKEDERSLLTFVLYGIIERNPDAIFYLGGTSYFDLECNLVLRRLQKHFPDIKRVLVTHTDDQAYLQNRRAADFYDEILYPFCDRSAPKDPIATRGIWLVNHADMLISYLSHKKGLEYYITLFAQEKGLKVAQVGKLAL